LEKIKICIKKQLRKGIDKDGLAVLQNKNNVGNIVKNAGTNSNNEVHWYILLIKWIKASMVSSIQQLKHSWLLRVWRSLTNLWAK
jgi:hypothetical protein